MMGVPGDRLIVLGVLIARGLAGGDGSILAGSAMLMMAFARGRRVF
jgi:hypothetical protein